jgi:hypothetical protein
MLWTKATGGNISVAVRLRARKFQEKYAWPKILIGRPQNRETLNVSFDQLYMSGGVDFSRILGPGGPQDFRGLILWERLFFKQPPNWSDANLALPCIYFKVISSNINKSKYSFWCDLVVVAQASPALPKLGPFDLRGNSSLQILELRLILPAVYLPP